VLISSTEFFLMLRIVLVHPGATDFDEQGRIKGTLNISLNSTGESQVLQTIDELSDLDLQVVYASPCTSALETAKTLASKRGVPLRKADKLQNLNHGLWHGKRIAEVKVNQPRVYKQCQDHPETVCPPQGEALEDAVQRIRVFVAKLLKKHRRGVVALVVPEPVLSIVRSILQDKDLGDLWQSECDNGGWEVIDIAPAAVK